MGFIMGLGSSQAWLLTKTQGAKKGAWARFSGPTRWD